MDISGTQLRALRAALFTALVVTLSTASHVLLSRAPLPLNTVAAVAVAVFALSYALAGRERGYGRIVHVQRHVAVSLLGRPAPAGPAPSPTIPSAAES